MYAILCGGLLLLSGVTQVWADESPDRIAYEVVFEGVTAKLLSAMEQQAQTFRNQSRPPVSMRQLNEHAQRDVARLQRVLESQGYYEGEVAVKIEHESKPIHIQFNVDPGPLYTIGSWNIVWPESLANQTIAPSITYLVKDQPAEASLIISAESQYLAQLRNRGYPFGKIQNRSIELDPNQAQVRVISHIEPGPSATFGDVVIEGLVGVKESLVFRYIRWQKGKPYRERRVEQLEKDLLSSGLFASAWVEPATQPKADGSLPIHIHLTERRHRTIRLGGSYVTDEQGLGAQASWEHRNLKGRGHRLRAELESTQIGINQTTSYLFPDFGYRNLDLLLELELAKEYPQAYSGQSTRAAATWGYHLLSWDMDVWAGFAQTNSSIEQQDVRTRYNIQELPVGFNWDHRDDPLNAMRGWQLMLQITPQTDLSKDIHFTKTYAEARLFQPLSWFPNTVFAMRLGTGAINGVALGNVPADRRFYSGGAGSVRGYAYQAIGPTTDGQPTGGLSLVETSLELRSTWNPRWGSVVFLDGGRVFAEVYSQEEEEDMRWAAGVGLRYFLDFGPLRFDIAFPLNKEGDDRSYQFYVSIGQAF